MQVQPYEPKSVWLRRQWTAAADAIGVNPNVLRKVYIDRWFVGMDRKDFLRLCTSPNDIPKNDRGGKKGFIATIREECEKVDLSEEEENRDIREAWIEADFSDLLWYRLKELIQIGDEFVSDETKTFFSSEQQYLTKGNRYKILTLRDEDGGEFGFTTETDIPGEINFTSNFSCQSIWRNGEEIWSWKKAYLSLWLEQNPNHPQTQEMINHLGGNVP